MQCQIDPRILHLLTLAILCTNADFFFEVRLQNDFSEITNGDIENKNINELCIHIFLI